MSLSDIGRQSGKTPEAVRQAHAKTLRELRKPRNSSRLRPFLPESEQIYSMGLSGVGFGNFNRTWTSATERAAVRLCGQ